MMDIIWFIFTWPILLVVPMCVLLLTPWRKNILGSPHLSLVCSAFPGLVLSAIWAGELIFSGDNDFWSGLVEYVLVGAFFAPTSLVSPFLFFYGVFRYATRGRRPETSHREKKFCYIAAVVMVLLCIYGQGVIQDFMDGLNDGSGG